MNQEELLVLFYDLFKKKLISLGYESTFKDIFEAFSIKNVHEDMVIAECQNLFFAQLLNNHLEDIKEIVKDVWGQDYQLYIRQQPIHESSEKKEKKEKKAKPSKPKALPQSKPQLFEETLSSSSESLPISFHPESTPLNSEFTFQSFVKGTSNALAYSACETVSKNPGVLTNPVFIYGSTGLGKTHLLHSVGNEIQRRHPTWKILYVTSEDFFTELISAIRNTRNEEFRHKYRSCDALLIDDIQFLEKKESTQNEFFFTFNELFQKKKQIVITSDKFPKDIPNIEDRLKSRFLQGLIADIEPPGFEDRVNIIDIKSKKMNLKLSRHLIEHLANCIKNNVREIEGVLNHLQISTLMTGEEPELSVINEYLKKIVRLDAPKLSISHIQQVVAEHFNLQCSDLISQARHKKLIMPRHIAMFLTREILNVNYVVIAEAFKRKDHTTVMHACRTVEELLEKENTMRADLNELRRLLNN